jgi:sarcosine oxidase/L-pipecolate oxidase
MWRQPDKSNIIKVARHGPGWLNPQPSTADPSLRVSVPRTAHYGGDSSDTIPRPFVKQLREALSSLVPGLADRPLQGTRLCWYVAPGHLGGQGCH